MTGVEAAPDGRFAGAEAVAQCGDIGSMAGGAAGLPG